MSVESRREKIAQIFLSENKVRVGELAKGFGVTTETIRKDLIALEQQGIIRRGNGSAEIMNENTEWGYARKSESAVAEKKAVAACAAKLIPEGASVFLDAGSTIYQLARQLILRRDIMAITNFMPVASLLSANRVKVILIGGEIRQTSGGATGQLAIDSISKINADMAFLSTSGFQGAEGPCVENFSDSSVKRGMMRQSMKSILLTDSTKAMWRAMVSFAAWQDMDTVISDDGLPDSARSAIEGKTKLITVSAKQQDASTE